MSKQGRIYDDVETAAAKLRVLSYSCAGVVSSEESNPDLIWFQGAEAMLKEAIDELQKVLRALGSSEDIVSTGGLEEAEEEAPTGEDS